MKRMLLFCGFLFLSGCMHEHLYPEMVEQTFLPRKGGIIQYRTPENKEDGHQYKLATSELMKKHCGGGKFHVLSAGGESGGYAHQKLSNDPVPVDFVRVRFECDEASPAQDKKDKATLEKELK
jgi:hypothetical protein